MDHVDEIDADDYAGCAGTESESTCHSTHHYWCGAWERAQNARDKIEAEKKAEVNRAELYNSFKGRDLSDQDMQHYHRQIDEVFERYERRKEYEEQERLKAKEESNEDG